MSINRPIHAILVIFCALALAAPATFCFTGAPAGTLRVMGVIQTLFTVWFVLLVQTCISEDRAQERERASREKRRE